MKETISKFDWLTAEACPAMVWYGLRTEPTAALNEADRFRMEQDQDIGALARQLFPGGILVTAQGGKSTAEVTQELMADGGEETLFEATVRPAAARYTLQDKSRIARSRTSCTRRNRRPHPLHSNPRSALRRTHKVSVFSASSISCRYTRYPGQARIAVSSLFVKHRAYPTLPNTLIPQPLTSFHEFLRSAENCKSGRAVLERSI
jgi:hypothetical protein